MKKRKYTKRRVKRTMSAKHKAIKNYTIKALQNTKTSEDLQYVLESIAKATMIASIESMLS